MRRGAKKSGSQKYQVNVGIDPLSVRRAHRQIDGAIAVGGGSLMV
jgi:hypothetical protein